MNQGNIYYCTTCKKVCLAVWVNGLVYCPQHAEVEKRKELESDIS